MNPSTINHKLSTRRIVLLLVVGGIAAFVLWPRPALELYTTPPLDSKGTRIQLLIPRGWKMTECGRLSTKTGDYLYLGSARSEIWYPEWLRELLRGHDIDKNDELMIWIDASVTERDGLEVGLNTSPYYGQAIRTIRGLGQWGVFYERIDLGRFKDTYRAILDSVKVL